MSRLTNKQLLSLVPAPWRQQAKFSYSKVQDKYTVYVSEGFDYDPNLRRTKEKRKLLGYIKKGQWVISAKFAHEQELAQRDQQIDDLLHSFDEKAALQVQQQGVPTLQQMQAYSQQQALNHVQHNELSTLQHEHQVQAEALAFNLSQSMLSKAAAVATEKVVSAIQASYSGSSQLLSGASEAIASPVTIVKLLAGGVEMSQFAAASAAGKQEAVASSTPPQNVFAAAAITASDSSSAQSTAPVVPVDASVSAASAALAPAKVSARPWIDGATLPEWQQVVHECFMAKAMEQADLAKNEGEVPVGAVLVNDAGEIVATGYNLTIKLHDATAHAEVRAIRAAGASLKNYRLNDLTLYVTLEPCCMCVMAAIHARIKTIVFGTSDPRTGACGSVFNLSGDSHHNHHLQVIGNVCQKECAQQLSSFFQQKRAAERLRKSQLTPEQIVAKEQAAAEKQRRQKFKQAKAARAAEKRRKREAVLAARAAQGRMAAEAATKQEK